MIGEVNSSAVVKTVTNKFRAAIKAALEFLSMNPPMIRTSICGASCLQHGTGVNVMP
jgi:hypothetical protein